MKPSSISHYLSELKHNEPLFPHMNSEWATWKTLEAFFSLGEPILQGGSKCRHQITPGQWLKILRVFIQLLNLFVITRDYKQIWCLDSKSVEMWRLRMSGYREFLEPQRDWEMFQSMPFSSILVSAAYVRHMSPMVYTWRWSIFPFFVGINITSARKGKGRDLPWCQRMDEYIQEWWSLVFFDPRLNITNSPIFLIWKIEKRVQALNIYIYICISAKFPTITKIINELMLTYGIKLKNRGKNNIIQYYGLIRNMQR